MNWRVEEYLDRTEGPRMYNKRNHYDCTLRDDTSTIRIYGLDGGRNQLAYGLLEGCLER